MEASLVSTSVPLWGVGTPAESGRNSTTSESSNALDMIVQAFGQIAEGFAGKSERADMNTDTLFDSNGAPQLPATDEPSSSEFAVSTPLNLGFLVADTARVNIEGINAKVNGDTNAVQQQMRSNNDKLVETQLNAINKFEQKSAEMAEKADRWYNRLAAWAAENLGPYMPYIGLAVAAIATVATAGAAWPMLAMAGMGLANHVLRSYDIDVVGGVTKAIKVAGSLVSEKGANALADTIGAAMGVLLSDPSQMSKLFGTIAKACGASKATIEKAEQWGQIFGMVVVVGVNLAMTWGSGAVNAVTNAASSAGGATRSVASAVSSYVSTAVKDFIRTIEPYVSQLIQLIRESSSRINDLSVFFRDAMLTAKGAAAGSLQAATTSALENAVKFAPKLDLVAKGGQTALNGANGLITGSNGWREYELASAQYGIDVSMIDRRQAEQLLAISREKMQDMDEGTKRSLDYVAQSLKSNSDMISNHVRDQGERAAIVAEQMTA